MAHHCCRQSLGRVASPIFFAAKYLQAHAYRVVPVNQLYANASRLVWTGPSACAEVVTNDHFFAMDTNGLIYSSANR